MIHETVGDGPRHLDITMPQPVISGAIKSLFEVVPQALVGKFKELTTFANAAEITDATSHKIAAEILVKIHAADKALEERRKEVKAPFIQTGKAIDDIMKSISDPIIGAKKSLIARISEYEQAEKRRIYLLQQEAEKKEREEREAHELERKKLQSEADAAAKIEADEAAELLGTPVEVVAEKPIFMPFLPAKPAAIIPAAPKSAVTQRTVKTLSITDASKIPRELGGIQLWTLNEMAVRKLIDAGVTVPGAEIIESKVDVMGRG